MSQKQFEKEIEKNLPSSLYYIYAKDYFLLKNAVDRISSLIPPEKRAFNVMVYDIDSAGETPVSLREIIDVLNTPGFFGERKIVLLRNLQMMKKKDIKPLYDYLKNPSVDSVLVMLSHKAPDREIRERLKGSSVISLDMKGQAIKVWLAELSRERGIEITPDAMDLLIGTTGADTGILVKEVEKISLLGRQRVDANDVSELIHGKIGRASCRERV